MSDQHQGKGGTYIRDPETGKRELAQRTEPAPVGEIGPEAIIPKSAIRAVKATEKGK